MLLSVIDELRTNTVSKVQEIRVSTTWWGGGGVLLKPRPPYTLPSIPLPPPPRT